MYRITPTPKNKEKSLFICEGNSFNMVLTEEIKKWITKLLWK